MNLGRYRLQGQAQQKIRPEHLDRAAIVRGGVAGRVRGVPLEPVDAHQPPRPQERTAGQLICHWHRDLGEDVPQGLKAQPLACPGDPARRRRPPAGIPASPRAQRPGQPGRDLLIVIFGEQRHRHREIHHDVRRQLPVRPPRAAACRADRVIDDVTRYRRSEHPERNLVRPPAASSHPSILRHKPGSSQPPASADGNTGKQDQLTVSGIVSRDR